MELPKKIEAILFYKGEPEKKKNLAKLLEISPEALEAGVRDLREQLTGRGVVLLEHDNELELRTSNEAADLISTVRRQELNRDLGRAGAETLAIVLYKAPVTRAEIDYIRGVNSSFILRNLMVRGLISRANPEREQRTYVYQPTLELLAHLGISRVEELPDYEKNFRELTTTLTKQESESN